MSLKDVYLRYGLQSDLAQEMARIGLSVSAVRETRLNHLVGQYGLERDVAKRIKSLVLREPIDEEVAQQLLVANAFTCCCCHGAKSHSFLIHHIEPYGQSQDNEWSNLAVLCPACHDLTHRSTAANLS